MYKFVNMSLFVLSLQRPVEDNDEDVEMLSQGATAPPTSPEVPLDLSVSGCHSNEAMPSTSQQLPSAAAAAGPATVPTQIVHPTCSLAAKVETSDDLDRMREVASRAATLPRAGTPMPNSPRKRSYDIMVPSAATTVSDNKKVRKNLDLETGENVSLVLI